MVAPVGLVGVGAGVVLPADLPDAYDRLVREAERRGVAPDVLADELVKADLAPVEFDLERALADLAGVRSRLCGGGMDAVAVVREGRDELERRGL